MNADLLIVAVAVGVGTWMFRFLPTRLNRVARAREGRLERFFDSTGPAAIATLFVASVLPGMIAEERRWIVLIGCLATGLTFRATRNVAVATLVGAVAYGLAFKLV